MHDTIAKNSLQRERTYTSPNAATRALGALGVKESEAIACVKDVRPRTGLDDQ
jgi:hypothetical protein